MSFIVETGDGVADANAYLDVAFARQYFDDEGRLSDWDGTALSKTITAADAAANTLTIDYDYETGDGPIVLTGIDLPAPLVAATEYWAVVVDGALKLATTYDFAVAEVPTTINLTDVGTGEMTAAHADFVAQRAAIVRATRYAENRWGELLVGDKGTDEQGLHFPATGVYRVVQGVTVTVEGVPSRWKQAIAELALLTMTSSSSLTSNAPIVTSESRGKGGVTRSVTYATPTASGGGENYRAVERMIAPFLRPLRTVRA